MTNKVLSKSSPVHSLKWPSFSLYIWIHPLTDIRRVGIFNPKYAKARVCKSILYIITRPSNTSKYSACQICWYNFSCRNDSKVIILSTGQSDYKWHLVQIQLFILIALSLTILDNFCNFLVMFNFFANVHSFPLFYPHIHDNETNKHNRLLCSKDDTLSIYVLEFM